MMFLKIGLISAIFALLMQIFILLSPLFLSYDNARVCIHIQRFSQIHHQHILQQQSLAQHFSPISQPHNHQYHHLTHDESHQHTTETPIDEKNIHLQHCDFCAIHSEFDLPKTLFYPIVHWFDVGYIVDFFIDYQQPFVSLRLFKLPLKHAPPLF